MNPTFLPPSCSRSLFELIVVLSCFLVGCQTQATPNAHKAVTDPKADGSDDLKPQPEVSAPENDARPQQDEFVTPERRGRGEQHEPVEGQTSAPAVVAPRTLSTEEIQQTLKRAGNYDKSLLIYYTADGETTTHVIPHDSVRGLIALLQSNAELEHENWFQDGASPYAIIMLGDLQIVVGHNLLFSKTGANAWVLWRGDTVSEMFNTMYKAFDKREGPEVFWEYLKLHRPVARKASSPD